MRGHSITMLDLADTQLPEPAQSGECLLPSARSVIMRCFYLAIIAITVLIGFTAPCWAEQDFDHIS